MTLILTVATGQNIFQASDRRLTMPDGVLRDDEANKAICVRCRNAHFVIAYTGLAEIGAKRTDAWIVEQLSAMKVGNKGIEQIADALKSELTATIGTLPVREDCKGLTLVIAGFHEGIPVVGFISNQKGKDLSRLMVPNDSFQKMATRPGSGSSREDYFLMSCEGAIDALTRPISKRIEKLRKQRFFHKSDPESICYELVSLVRSAARTARGKVRIGRSCMSVAYDCRTGRVLAAYHPSSAGPIVYAPHVVGTTASIWNIQIWRGANPPENWWKN